MKAFRFFFLFFVFSLFLAGSVSASLDALPVTYYEFDENGGATIFDSFGINNLSVCPAAAWSSDAKIGNYSLINSFNTDCNYYSVQNVAVNDSNNDEGTVFFWSRKIVGGNTNVVFRFGDDVSSDISIIKTQNGLGASTYRFAGETGSVWSGDGYDVFNFYFITWDADRFHIYVDDVLRVNQSYSGSLDLDSLSFLKFNNAGLDGFGFFNKKMSSDAGSYLYNSGAGCDFECIQEGLIADVRVVDVYDGSALEGLNVTWAAQGVSVLTDSDGGADCLGCVGDLSFTVQGGSSYFDGSGVSNTDNETVVGLVGALYTLSATDLLGNTIDVFNVSSGLQSNETLVGLTSLVLRPNASNVVLFEAEGYLPANVTINTSGRDLGAFTYDEAFTGVLSVNATDAWNGGGIQNFTLNVTGDNGYQQFFNVTTGWANFTLVGGSYLLEFKAEGFEFLNHTLLFENETQSYTFSSLPAASIDITIRDAETSALITDNMTIRLTSDDSGELVFTTTGGYFTEEITPAFYTVDVFGGGYEMSSYVVEATEGRVYFLTAYLQTNTTQVIMQYIDQASNAVLEGVSVSQQRIINGTWKSVSTKNTDITGRTAFQYLPDTPYRFVAIKEGYENKQFLLDPILFNEYLIRLDRSTSSGFSQILVDYGPRTFTEDQTTNMTILFSSPPGRLASYSYSVAWPGGGVQGSGNNVVGESFLVPVTPTGATIVDRVYINLSYVDSAGETHTFTYNHGISVEAGSGTWSTIEDNTFGLGLLTRILVGTALIIAMAGFLTVVAGPIPGLGLGLLMMGLFVYLGFWPWWSIGLSLVVGFALLAARSD